MIRYLIPTVGLALALAAPFVFLVPAGEAPDEPSHFLYLDHMLRHGSLPPVVGDGPSWSPDYEAYQPPLPYLVMAGALVMAGVERVDFPHRPDPDFAFQKNRRMFLPAPPSARAAEALRAVRVARAANLLWLALASGAILMTCLRVSSSSWVALAAGVPFALSPQLLFTSSIVGNDAAVTALTSAAVACLVSLATSPGLRAALGASTFAGLALWAKSSSAVVAPAIAVLLVGLVARRRFRIALALTLPGLALAAGWAALELMRTGTVLPSPPTGWHAGEGIVRVLTEPRWVASAWSGFWARFGWLNVFLPWPAYLAFVPPSLAALFGLYLSCGGPVRSRGVSRRSASRTGWLLGIVVAANVLLLVLILVRLGWQPQGRYLLPSIAAVAGLAALGLDRAVAGLRPETVRFIAWSSWAVSVSVAAGALAVVAKVY